ncbi:GNAT family N-acetyltransferase [Teredinibacter turnerae]|uniref:GNAT family N-acetyltransferase n=1 Tax=Teredinibacter turnerae TaxID=2426 RepID=UPI0030D4406B
MNFKKIKNMIKIAKTEEEIVECFHVLSALRPHLHADSFVARIDRSKLETGYTLAYFLENDVKAVVGFRISEWLHSGKYLEIEELITKEGERSKGYGGKLFDWIVQYAQKRGGNQVRLVSGVSREEAHKFYIGKGMAFEAKYFSLNVEEQIITKCSS